jgi:hypothetical protein
MNTKRTTILAACTLMLTSGCGRSSMIIPADVETGRTSSPDAAARDARSTTDLQVSDVQRVDVASPDVLRDASAPDTLPARCPLLARYGVLNVGHIKKAMFSADGRSLLVRIAGSDTRANDIATWIGIPSGESRGLSKDVRDVEWLGKNAALITTPDQLVAMTLEGKHLGSVAGSTCEHVATPDGSRVYYITGAYPCSSGPLNVLDIATGARKQIAESVSTSRLAVSPDSRWVAYVAFPGPSGQGVVAVVDATGASQAVVKPTSGTYPQFVSDTILLFQSYSAGSSMPSLWSYDLGSRKSQLLGEGDLGLSGYEIAADRSSVLLAKLGSDGKAGELFRIAVVDGAGTRLAGDVLNYRTFAMPIRAFAWATPSKRVIYLSDTSSPSARLSTIASVTPDGKERVQLAAGQPIAISTFADRLAIVSIDGAQRTGIINVTSAAGAKHFAVDVIGSVASAAFVPRDRGLLFVDGLPAGNKRLRHLSFVTGAVVTLAEWSSSTLSLDSFPVGIRTQSYPVDPSGCFTVVDSDFDQSASRLVAIPD